MGLEDIISAWWSGDIAAARADLQRLRQRSESPTATEAALQALLAALLARPAMARELVGCIRRRPLQRRLDVLVCHALGEARASWSTVAPLALEDHAMASVAADLLRDPSADSSGALRVEDELEQRASSASDEAIVTALVRRPGSWPLYRQALARGVVATAVDRLRAEGAEVPPSLLRAADSEGAHADLLQRVRSGDPTVVQDAEVWAAVQGDAELRWRVRELARRG